jgi:hypothetical protein
MYGELENAKWFFQQKLFEEEMARFEIRHIWTAKLIAIKAMIKDPFPDFDLYREIDKLNEKYPSFYAGLGIS